MLPKLENNYTENFVDVSLLRSMLPKLEKLPTGECIVQSITFIPVTKH